jgi:hypothetical protein
MSCPRFGEECYEFMCGSSKNGICTEGENEFLNSIEKSSKAELISAAEAYKKTQEALKEDDIESLKEINSKILEATKKGKFSVTGLGEISFGARKKIESLGYKIITGFDLNESYYLISWEKEEN